MVTPFCGFLIWHVHKKKHYANVIASLPFALFFTEWYLTVFAERYFTAGENLSLLIVYTGMTFSLLAVVPLAFGAVFFALQSAVLSVLLEWFYPIRDWKIESDLWHHPRKYVVPAVMLLLAGAVSAWPILLYEMLVLLAVETIIFIFICWR